MKKIILSFVISLVVCMYSTSVFATTQLQQSNSSNNQITSEIVQNNEGMIFPKNKLFSSQSNLTKNFSIDNAKQNASLLVFSNNGTISSQLNLIDLDLAKKIIQTAFFIGQANEPNISNSNLKGNKKEKAYNNVLNTTSNIKLTQDNFIITDNISNITQVANSYIDPSMGRISNQNNIIIANTVTNVTQLAYANMRDGQDIKFKQKNLIITTSALKVFQGSESFPSEYEGLNVEIENSVESNKGYESYASVINYIVSLIKNNNDDVCIQYNIILANRVENVKQVCNVYNNDSISEEFIP